MRSPKRPKTRLFRLFCWDAHYFSGLMLGRSRFKKRPNTPNPALVVVYERRPNTKMLGRRHFFLCPNKSESIFCWDGVRTLWSIFIPEKIS